MAPIRRYLRITKYSVVECRIYPEYPHTSESWLLGPNDPALPRIIEAIRPLVLPKLREENERASKGKGRNKKNIKDVVVQDDFEVSLWFTETSTRHSILTKHKTFNEKPRIKSNSGKLTEWLNTSTADKPMEITDDDTDVPILREDDDEPINLDDIPDISTTEDRETGDVGIDTILVNDSEDSGQDFQSCHQEDDDRHGENRAKLNNRGNSKAQDTACDDKRKLGIRTIYDGFSIYGRILCLMIKRRGGRVSAGVASSQQLMENWISTQAAQEGMVDED